MSTSWNVAMIWVASESEAKRLCERFADRGLGWARSHWCAIPAWRVEAWV